HPAPIPVLAEHIERTVVQVIGLTGDGRLLAGGTGFFVSANGYVLTCWHVVAPPNVQNLRLRLSNGSECPVEGIVAFSALEDWALLKTDRKKMDFLSLRSSAGEKPATGVRVLVFGNPGQLRCVWSEGAVSGFVFNIRGTDRDALRFDAPV